MANDQNKFEVEISGNLDGLNKAINEGKGELKGLSNEAKSGGGVFKSLSGVFAGFNANLGGANVNLGQASSSLSRVAGGFKSAAVGARTFGAALIATGIGAIVVLIGTLISAFASTQEGMDSINKVMVPLKAGFGALWGVLQRVSLMLSGSLVKAFKDPKQAMSDLLEFIKNQFIVRFQASYNAILELSKAIGNALKFDFEAAKKNMQAFGSEYADMLTGVKGTVDKLKDAVKGVNEEFQRGVALGKAINEEEVKLRKQLIEHEKRLAIISTELERQRTLSRDTTATLEDRLAAAKNEERLATAYTNERRRVLEQELKILKLKKDINDTDDAAYKEIGDKEAEIIRLKAEQESSLRRNYILQQGITAEIEKQRVASQYLAMSAEMKHVETAITSIQDELRELNTLFEDTSIDGEIFLTAEQVEQQRAYFKALAEEANRVLPTLEQFASLVGESMATAFDVLFDSSKGFADFAESIKMMLLDMIKQMIKAAVTAAILAAAIKSIPGLNLLGLGGAGGGFMDIFKSLQGIGSSNMFGVITGQDIQLSNQRATSGNNRSGTNGR